MGLGVGPVAVCVVSLQIDVCTFPALLRIGREEVASVLAILLVPCF